MRKRAIIAARTAVSFFPGTVEYTAGPSIPVEPAFVRSFDEVGDLPDDWGMFSYANLNFAMGKAFLEYEYRVGPYGTDEQDGRGGWKMGWRTQARKRRVLPVEWFYDD